MRYADIITSITVDPISITAAAVVVLGLVVLGLPLIGNRDGGPIVNFAVGMGAVVSIFTVIGTLTDIDFRLLAGICGALAVIAALISYRRGILRPTLTFAVLSLLTVAVLVIMVSSRQASEWDEFSHWLHASRYLFNVNLFPGPPGRPEIASCCAAYPYGWPLINYLAQFFAGFSEALPALINVMLLGLFGGLVATLLVPGKERPGFIVIALGTVGTTLLGPTFVSKLVFSSYADNVTNVLVGVGVFLAYRLNERFAEGNRGAIISVCLALGLTGAALLSVKPGNLVLLVGILGGFALLAIRERIWSKAPVWPLLITIALPALTFVVWRHFVGQYLQGEEMAILPREQWNIEEIPQILMSMASVAAHKGGYFALMLIVVALGLRGLWRPRTEVDRLAVIAGALFLGYNLFLLFSYVTIFGGYESVRAASFWRYNTHLGLAGMLVAATVIRVLWQRFVAPQGWSRQGWLKALPILVLIVAPIGFAKSIRFDLDPMKTFIRETMRSVEREVPPSAHIALFDPEGTGLGAVMASYEWDGAPTLTNRVSAFTRDNTIERLFKNPATDYALVLSGHSGTNLVPNEPKAFLLSREKAWAPVQSLPFPGDDFPKRYP